MKSGRTTDFRLRLSEAKNGQQTTDYRPKQRAKAIVFNSFNFFNFFNY